MSGQKRVVSNNIIYTEEVTRTFTVLEQENIMNQGIKYIDGTLDRPDTEEQESLSYRSQMLRDDIGNFWIDGC